MSVESIKITFDCPMADGTLVDKEMTVKLNTIKPTKKIGKGKWSIDYMKTYEMDFALSIPDHVHKKLCGRRISSRALGNGLGGEQSREYSKSFGKTIKATTIEELSMKWLQIVNDYLWLVKMDSANLQMVIFYKFDNGANEATKAVFDGNGLGFKASLQFKYSVGYIAETGTGNNVQIHRYNSNKTFISNHTDEEGFYKYKYVLWTPERQAYFDNLQAIYQSLIKQIDDFDGRVNEDGIDKIISEKKFILMA